MGFPHFHSLLFCLIIVGEHNNDRDLEWECVLKETGIRTLSSPFPGSLGLSAIWHRAD